MIKNGVLSDLVGGYINITVDRIQESSTEPRILALYCNKVWNADYEKSKDVEDLVKELCAVAS